MTDKKQSIVWTVLPVSRDEKKLRLSVFVSPRLACSGTRIQPYTLSDFPDFLDWTQRVQSSLTFRILFSSGATIDVSPDTKDLVPGLWTHLFPEKKYVKCYKFPADEAKTIISYPVIDAVTFLKDVYGEIGAQVAQRHNIGSYEGYSRLEYMSLDNLPKQEMPIIDYMPVLDGKTKFAYNNSETYYYDKMYTHPGPGLGPIPKEIMTYFRANLFFNRPEADKYTKDCVSVKKGDDVFVRVPRFDFHQILSTFGDHPLVMKKLGLVIELECVVPENIGETGWIRVVPLWNIPFKYPATDLCPQTHYVLTNERFFARSSDNDLITDGWLNLKNAGDLSDSTKKFSLTEVEADGSVLKGSQFSDTLAARKSNVTGLPALRSGGISLVYNDRGKWLGASFNPPDPNSQKTKNDILEQSTPDSKQILDLHAEDILRGYRIDIEDTEKPGFWYSLCKRNGKYQVLKRLGDSGENEFSGSDEGYVKRSSAASQGDKNILYVHESLFHWDGWSLCVKRPGQTITQEGDTFDPEATENNDDIGIQWQYTLSPGTLPALRFGHTYRIRVRGVDLCGNDMTGDVEKEKSKNVEFASNPITYHRFEPLSPPAMLPRKDYTEGESLENMVIRSGDVKNAKDYAVWLTKVPKKKPDHPEYSGTCERHIAPPKTSEMMAERHGKFDSWIGNQLAKYQDGFDIAKRERNTLEEEIDHVSSKFREFYDQDSLEISYLPDPITTSVIFTGLPGVLAKQGINEPVLAYSFIPEGSKKTWPDQQEPFRLVLTDIPPPEPEENEPRELRVCVPPGEVYKVRYCCAFENPDISKKADFKKYQEVLNSLGMADWILHANPKDTKMITTSIVHGQHWMLAPYRELTLVHAVQRPLKAPEITQTFTKKKIGDTFAQIHGTFSVDAKSTGKVELRATWTDWIDDPNDENGVKINKLKGHVFERTVETPLDNTIDIPDTQETKYRHEFGDTKHRLIDYSLCATTRFRDYFPTKITDDVKNLILKSVNPYRVSVDNSARPSAPKIVYVIPVFEWVSDDKPLPQIHTGNITPTKKLTTKKQIRKGGGLRVYLERPWFSSGEGEKLGVVLWEGNGEMNDFTMSRVTRWGRDPIFGTDPHSPPTSLPGPEAFETITKKAGLTLEEFMVINENTPKVSVAGYPVLWDDSRHLWYADIQMKPGTAYFPFVRLALARYQQDSIENAHLSPVVLADFAQLTPDRTASIVYEADHPMISNPVKPGRPDIRPIRKIKVVVSGVVNYPEVDESTMTMALSAPNIVEIRLEKTIPGISDPNLRWTPADNKVIRLEQPTTFENTIATWKAEIIHPEPKGSEQYRVMIREYEWFVNDDILHNYSEGITPSLPNGSPENFNITKTEQRLVYAQAFEL